MPTQVIELSSEIADLLAEHMESGKYGNAGDVLRESLRVLETRDEVERLRASQLRAMVEESEKDFEDGRFTTVASAGEHRELMADILREAKSKRGLC